MSFQVALSGLNAASTALEVTSNNIANANTTGFKGARAEFADVFSGDAVGIGNGVRLANVRQEFTQGNVAITGRQLDLAISGNGFFITNSDTGILYSRVGAFGLSPDGYVQNSSSERLQVYPPLVNGAFNTGALGDLRITSDTAPPTASTTVEMQVNLPANATDPAIGPFDPANPATYNNSTSTIVYDSLGVGHTSTYFFARNGADWDVYMTVDGTPAGAAPQTVTFSSTGQLATPASGIISFPAVNPGNGAAPLPLNVDMAKATQFGSDFTVNTINPDGQAAGRLRSVEIDQTGVVFARYSNGVSTALGKIALANFSNPEGLVKTSDTSFQETFDSGVPVRGEATQSTFGQIQSGSLEASNVDLTEQLVNTIATQRWFQANAQVISALDEITQTIINIR